MLKEDFSDLNYSSTYQDIGTTDADAVAEAEKELNKQSNALTSAGLITLVAGVALVALAATTSLTGTLGTIAVSLAALGTGAFLFSSVRLWRKVLRKKNIEFPPLRLLKKAEKEIQEHSAKLSKSQDDRVFLGVAGGLAEYSGIPAGLMRLIFILGFLFSGGIVMALYILLALVLPNPRKKAKKVKATVKEIKISGSERTSYRDDDDDRTGGGGLKGSLLK